MATLDLETCYTSGGGRCETEVTIAQGYLGDFTVTANLGITTESVSFTLQSTPPQIQLKEVSFSGDKYIGS